MWNEKFNRDDYLYGTEPNDFLRVASLILPDEANILCLAEGEGRNATFLAQQGHKVTAMDASEVGLAKAQRLAQANEVEIEIEQADLEHFTMGEQQWDAIVAVFCHLPPKLRSQVSKKIIQGLKPGGFYIAEAYAKAQLQHDTGGPKDPELLIDLAEIQQEMTELNWIHAQQIEREVIEGSGHTGTGWVTQVIGQKPLDSNSE